MLTHVVLMKFADPEDVAEAQARLAALPAEIAEIRSLQVGLDVGRTPASFDLCLTTTHDDLAGYRSYVDHPTHQVFAAWLGPRLADRALVDFES